MSFAPKEVIDADRSNFPSATSLGAVVLFLGFAAPSWTGCAASARHPFPEIAREEAGYLEPGVPPGATCDRVQVNGAQLHYIDHGGTGPTMIFLAGLGNSAHIWDEFAPRFTDQCHVYAFTRRGFGESDQPDGGYDTCRLAEDVIALMDALQLTRATLVGHSVAGDELSEIGVRFPDRIDRLIYLDAAYDRSHGTRRLLVALLAINYRPPRPNRIGRIVRPSPPFARTSNAYTEWSGLQAKCSRPGSLRPTVASPRTSPRGRSTSRWSEASRRRTTRRSRRRCSRSTARTAESSRMCRGPERSASVVGLRN
ncbi:MAG: alpha/beta hydrolase [Candidatus Eisenbacteria bacterium]|nr:alpha/beta hydrolase [Candidatus Eisenbacteria bacterium]